jgi:hypothetical protein
MNDARLGFNQSVLREGCRAGGRRGEQSNGRLSAPGHGQT